MDQMTGLFRQVVATLTDVPQQERDRLAGLEKSEASHRAAFADTALMRQVRRGGTPRQGALPLPLTVAAWNLERCLMPEDSAAVLAREGADLVLLSEMDDGMARSSQRDTTAAVAEPLGMAFAYAVEFLELSLGSARESHLRSADFNKKGFHGNAMLAACPILDPVVIRLDDDGRWFTGDKDQARIGGRIAVAGFVETTAGRLLAVTTHLENAAPPSFRAEQMQILLDAIEAIADGAPVIIGGDMNTNAIGPDADWSAEPLFAVARERGYAVHGEPIAQTTMRQSLISPAPTRYLKLDWFFSRGLDVRSSRIVPAVRDDGTPLSDHDLIVCEIAGLRT